MPQLGSCQDPFGSETPHAILVTHGTLTNMAMLKFPSKMSRWSPTGHLLNPTYKLPVARLWLSESGGSSRKGRPQPQNSVAQPRLSAPG